MHFILFFITDHCDYLNNRVNERQIKPTPNSSTKNQSYDSVTLAIATSILQTSFNSHFFLSVR